MSEVKISSRLNRKLSSSEEAFVNSLKEHCGNDDNITNMFIYGSLIQPQSHVDEYSDLDIMIVQNNFRHIIFQEKDAFLLSCQTYRQELYLEYLLCDGHTIDLAILSEKEWKKNWQILPEFYASVISRGIKFLIKKNNLISDMEIPYPIGQAVYENRYLDIWYEFISAYFSLVKMYMRKDMWRIYGYGIRISESISSLISLKNRERLYQKYSKTGNIKKFFSDAEIPFVNYNPLQTGRCFGKYATLRQKQIFCIIHKLTECHIDEILKLYDLIAEEFCEVAILQINFVPENIKLFRKYILLLLKVEKHEDSALYCKDLLKKQEQACKLINSFLS